MNAMEVNYKCIELNAHLIDELFELKILIIISVQAQNIYLLDALIEIMIFRSIRLLLKFAKKCNRKSVIKSGCMEHYQPINI